MGEIRENVKRNLGYYLSLTGLSQKEFAHELGVSQAAVTNWIKGNNSPDIEMVAKICRVLNLQVADLFGDCGKADRVKREEELLRLYRAQPEMQPAVHRLLGLDVNKLK